MSKNANFTAFLSPWNSRNQVAVRKKENHNRNRYNPRAAALLPGDTAQELAQKPKLRGFWAPSPCEKEK